MAERRSQLCLGIDPDPAGLGEAAPGAGGPGAESEPAAAAAGAVAAWCERLIAAAAPACVAAKFQLACFERLGAPGRRALEQSMEAARAAGLLVIADGKRGDVPVSATAYAQGLLGATPTPWGPVPGLGADAATLNPLMGADSLAPFVAAAEASGAGVFALVRTSNPGAADILDLETAEGVPLFERLAGLVDGFADRLAGESGLSGAGAVVGATEPRHLGRLRELMPRSVFLIPGVGAQGGTVDELAPAFANHPAGAIVTASRSIATSADPASAAAALRDDLWRVSAQ